MNNKEEQEKLKLLNEDMYCTRYEEYCLDVPYEVLKFIDGFGFSDYDCDLNCKECEHMELW